MLTNGRSSAVDGLCYNGCSCHNSPASRRKAKKGAKAKEKKIAMRTERNAY